MDNNEEDKKQDDNEVEIEVVTGDISDLDVSPVHEHLLALRPKTKEEDKKKHIIIPEATAKIEKHEDDPAGNKVTMIMDDEEDDNIDINIIDELTNEDNDIDSDDEDNEYINLNMFDDESEEGEENK